jgi:hypothetical protein
MRTVRRFALLAQEVLLAEYGVTAEELRGNNGISKLLEKLGIVGTVNRRCYCFL